MTIKINKKVIRKKQYKNLIVWINMNKNKK